MQPKVISMEKEFFSPDLYIRNSEGLKSTKEEV